MDRETIEREIERVDKKIDEAYRFQDKDRLRGERAVLRNQLDKLSRAEAEPVDVWSGTAGGREAEGRQGPDRNRA